MLAIFALWNRATESPSGIEVASANPALLMARLYAARRDCGHNAYANYVIRQGDNHIWIIPR